MVLYPSLPAHCRWKFASDGYNQQCRYCAVCS